MISMSKWPQPFWAVILASMGFSLAVLVLYSGADKDIKIAVIGLATSIVTGALGYIGGHSAGQAASQNPSTLENPAQLQ